MSRSMGGIRGQMKEAGLMAVSILGVPVTTFPTRKLRKRRPRVPSCSGIASFSPCFLFPGRLLRALPRRGEMI